MPVISDPDPQVHVFTVGNDVALPEPTYYTKGVNIILYLQNRMC